jgi:hypothetical protein
MMPPKPTTRKPPPAQATDTTAPTDATATSTTKPKLKTKLLGSAAISKPVKPSKRTKAAAKTNGASDAATAATGKLANTIDLDAAIAEGKEILANVRVAERRYYRLGQLAAGVETQYGKKTLTRFAAKLDISACTLERYRDVYNRWDGADPPIPAPERFSYAVLKELATHGDKPKIIREYEHLTKRKAHALMREYRADNPPDPNGKKKNGKPKGWKEIIREHRRALRHIHRLATELVGYTKFANEPMTADQLLNLRAGIEAKLLPDLSNAGVELQILALCLTKLDRQDPEDIRHLVVEPTTLVQLHGQEPEDTTRPSATNGHDSAEEADSEETDAQAAVS